VTELNKPKKTVRKPRGQKLDTLPVSLADDPRDTWLGKQLNSLYGPVVDEPLPEDMLRLFSSRKH
jgi:hypothetical protein